MSGTVIKPIAAALLAFAVFSLPPPQSPVPVSREPRHHWKFENQFVRVFDVLVPPGDATLFHIHANDYVFVTIGGARLKAEVMGDRPSDLNLTAGEVRFSKAPLTHRVTNVGPTPFRNITVEILSATNSTAAAPSPEPVAGHTPVLENERVRVSRLILGPGQSTGMHTHGLPGLTVVVSAGEVTVEAPGQRREKIKFRPGSFRWHTGALTHSLKNVGSSRFEAIEMEWK